MPDTIEALENLLEGAKTGEVTGLAFVATMGGNRYVTDVAGACYESPRGRRCVNFVAPPFAPDKAGTRCRLPP